MRSLHSFVVIGAASVLLAACMGSVQRPGLTDPVTHAVMRTSELMKRRDGRVLDEELGASFSDPGPSFARHVAMERAVLTQLIRAAGPEARAYVLRDAATATFLLYTVVPGPELTLGWIAAFQEGKQEQAVEGGGTIVYDEVNEAERYARLDSQDEDGVTTFSFTRFLPRDDDSTQIVSLSVGGQRAETLADLVLTLSSE